MADAGRGLSGLRQLERPGWDWRFGSAPPGESAPLSSSALPSARNAESSRVSPETRGGGPQSDLSAVAAGPRL